MCCVASSKPCGQLLTHPHTSHHTYLLLVLGCEGAQHAGLAAHLVHLGGVDGAARQQLLQAGLLLGQVLGALRTRRQRGAEAAEEGRRRRTRRRRRRRRRRRVRGGGRGGGGEGGSEEEGEEEEEEEEDEGRRRGGGGVGCQDPDNRDPDPRASPGGSE